MIEGANGPTTTEADDILNDKGVLVCRRDRQRRRRDGELLRMGAGLLQLLLGEDEINARLVRIMQRGLRGHLASGAKSTR